MHAWSLLLLIAGAYASPMFSNLVVHESIPNAPRGFTQMASAPANQILNLRIALSNSDMAGLEEVFYAVSTPGNALYGQHLSKEEVEEYVRPTNETTSIVNEFLLANNISAKTISPAGDWLAFSIPVSQANDLFGANYSVFKHEATGSQITRTLSYSIPAELQGHLELVHPSISFDVPVIQPLANMTRLSSPPNVSSSRLGTRQTAPTSCQDEITPNCLQALYGIPTTPATQSSNRIGIVGLFNNVARTADFKSYLTAVRPDITDFTFSFLSVDGGSIDPDSQTFSTSPNTDAYTQVAAGLASKVPMTFILVGTDVEDGPLNGQLDMVNTLLAENSPPQVLSSSYSQDEDTVSVAVANQLCNAFMQLGARGVSVLVMSGNGGVSGSGQQSEECTEFVPTFPASCPFVTSVGSTFGIAEQAWPLSSGGFSNIFSTPTYQTTVVENYLSLIESENEGLFNPTGRGFPDVSAQGMNTAFIWELQFFSVSGSDIATSVFSSVIALLNDELISQGRPVMGFLNPFLYSVSSEESILNDIGEGSNLGCGTTGFPTLRGWDPVTGLGSPNFPSLQSFLGL